MGLPADNSRADGFSLYLTLYPFLDIQIGRIPYNRRLWADKHTILNHKRAANSQSNLLPLAIMSIELPPPLPPSLQLQVIEQLGEKKPVLAGLVGQVIKATVVKSESKMLNTLISTDKQTGKSTATKTTPQLSAASYDPTKSTLNNPQNAIVKQSTATQWAILLRVGSNLLNVQSDKPLPQGSQVELKVINARQLEINLPSESKTQTSDKITLQHNLREILPRQQPYSQLLNLVRKMPAQQMQQLPPPVQDAIKHLIQELPHTKQLQSAKELQHVLRNSGIFTEKRLVRAATALKPDPLATIKTSSQTGRTNNNENSGPANSTKALLHKIQNLLANNSKQINTIEQTPTTAKSNVQTQSNASQIREIAQQDFKLNVAKLAHTLIEQLPNSSSVSNPWQLLQAAPSSSTDDVGQQLKRLANLIKSNSAQTSQPTKTTSEETKNADIQQTLQRVLLQQTLATLSRTQLHQLNSMPASAEPNVINHWVLELPVLHGEQIDSFLLEIEEEDKEQEDAEHKLRQWTVMLSFDLDGLGPLYVQLIVVNNNVSAKIWAEQTNTLQRVEAEISNLHNSLSKLGVTVKTLDCFKGKPANHNTRLEQQLIDTHS